MKVVIYSEIDWSFLEQRHHFIARRFRDEGFEVVFYQRVVGRIPTIRDIRVLLKSFLSGRSLVPKVKMSPAPVWTPKL